MDKNLFYNKNSCNKRYFFLFTVFLLFSSTFFVFSPLVSASVYSPGISVGQCIKYNVSETPQVANSLSWSRIDITAISGYNVSLTTSGQYINGTIPQPNTLLYNFVDNSITTITGPNTSVHMIFTSGKTVYESIRCDSAWLPVSGIVTAANLPSNDSLLWGSTTTEQRTYLGVTRTVNVCRITFSSTDNATVVYDKISGMMLEMAVKANTLVSSIVSDTNIFSTTPPTPAPTPITPVPGIYVGQYANYTVTERFGINNSRVWSQVLVTSLNGTTVSLGVTGQLTNGTVLKDGLIFNLTSTYLTRSGTSLSSYLFYAMKNGVLSQVAYIAEVNGYWIPRFGPIIAKDLKQGDSLWNPTTTNGYVQNTVINKTQTMSYLGSDRSVNIVNIWFSGYNETVVYDQFSGMMLEMSVYDTNSSPNRTLGVKLMDTNSFNSPIPETPTFAILAVILAFGASVLLTVNKKIKKQKCAEKAQVNIS